MSWLRLLAGSGAALACGCAQIQTSSVVEIIPKEGAPAVVFGPPAAAVTARGATAKWTQHGDAMQFEVYATRQCAVLRHDPVVRVERITKKSGGAVYWEFGIGAALLAGGLTGLIAPQLFGQRAINANGETVRDTAAGYRIGGILTGLSAIAIGAGIYDVVRTRDEVRYTDAYRAHVGEAARCDEPERPLANRSFELVVGEYHVSVSADAEGRARMPLPGEDELAGPADAPIDGALSDTARGQLEDGGFFDPARFADTEPASPERLALVTDDAGGVSLVPEPRVLSGVLRLGGRQALSFDFVVPYDSDRANAHHGEIVIEPQPVVQAPARPRPVADDVDEGR